MYLKADYNVNNASLCGEMTLGRELFQFMFAS